MHTTSGPLLITTLSLTDQLSTHKNDDLSDKPTCNRIDWNVIGNYQNNTLLIKLSD